MTKKSISRLLQASLMCCLAVLFTACDDIFASEDNPTPAYLSMSDKPVTLKVGDTYRRKAISVTTAVVEYTSSKTDVATVDNEGLVTAKAEGTTTITATATGYSSQNGKKIYQPASVSYVVTVTPAASATITNPPVATPGDIAACSETALVTAGVADGGTMMYEVTTTNTKPATTEGFGATIPTAANLGVGTYYVWYYAKGNTGYNDSEIAASAVEVTVVPTKSTPLTVEAITAGTITVNSPKAGMQYSLNGGTKTAVSGNISVSAGDKVAFYGNGISITSYNGTKIGGDGDGFKCKVYGNIMSLVDETGFATATTLTGGTPFAFLFDGNAKLTDASGLLLPATTLTGYCYYDMFRGCTSLTAAPELPATTLTAYCYYGMFNGCTSLTAAPELPATDLTGASYCYSYMFQGCTSLTTAPELKATKIADACYSCMFAGCTNLTTAPAELPAMTMASQCYAAMFFNCTSLTTAPKLPATTLGNACYYCMFYGCTSLTTAYVKAAYTNTNSGVECDQMFYGCAAAGAVLHTSSGNVSGWSGYMGSIGSNWSVVGDY